VVGISVSYFGIMTVSISASYAGIILIVSCVGIQLVGWANDDESFCITCRDNGIALKYMYLVFLHLVLGQ